MAQYCYPFINQATTDTQYTTLARNWCFTGITGEVGNSALQIFAQADGMQVYVKPTTTNNTAVINGFCFVSTTIEAVHIDIADNDYARIDTVVVRVHQTDDGTETRGELAVVKGIPSANPAPPALQQTTTDLYEFPLADVLVPASAVTIFPQNVTPDRRVFARKQEVDVLLGTNFGNYAGVLPQEKIGNLPASKITSGTLPIARGGTGATDAAAARSNLGANNAANITSGTLSADRIPGLSASKITSGTLAEGRLPLAFSFGQLTPSSKSSDNKIAYYDINLNPSNYVVVATPVGANNGDAPRNICKVRPNANTNNFTVILANIDGATLDSPDIFYIAMRRV
jgi:hypothetical protein